MKPFLDLKKQLEPIKDEIHDAVLDVIDSGNYIMGDEVKKFEEEISKYLDVKHAIACASGSDALLLSLMAIKIKPGDEIITTPFTFFATGGSIARLGAKPVFVDIREDTFNIDENKIEEAITEKTKAIMPVHLFGHPAEMNKIMDLAKKHNLKVIEDAAQAIGSEYDGKKAGTLGDFGCFSFFPTKNLGCMGDGGMIVTNNDEYAEYLKKARVHGASKKYHHDFVGINSRLDAIQAAILRVKLKYLDKWNEERRQNANKLNEKYKDKYILPIETENCKHTYHQYSVLIKENQNREEEIIKLKEEGEPTNIYYPVPLHLQ